MLELTSFLSEAELCNGHLGHVRCVTPDGRDIAECADCGRYLTPVLFAAPGAPREMVGLDRPLAS
jgi:hypothetical protein